jgi:hypothetical protein
MIHSVITNHVCIYKEIVDLDIIVFLLDRWVDEVDDIPLIA